MSAESYTDVLSRRAHRLARRGDFRKAALALRERAALVNDGASWVRLGAMLLRAGRIDEGRTAMRTGLFLHRRTGALGRARTVARMLDGEPPASARTGQRRLRPTGT